MNGIITGDVLRRENPSVDIERGIIKYAFLYIIKMQHFIRKCCIFLITFLLSVLFIGEKRKYFIPEKIFAKKFFDQYFQSLIFAKTASLSSWSIQRYRLVIW